MQEAEPRRKCVPRQEPGNERFRGGDQREVSKKAPIHRMSAIPFKLYFQGKCYKDSELGLPLAVWY